MLYMESLQAIVTYPNLYIIVVMSLCYVGLHLSLQSKSMAFISEYSFLMIYRLVVWKYFYKRMYMYKVRKNNRVIKDALFIAVVKEFSPNQHLLKSFFSRFCIQKSFFRMNE